MTTKGEKIISEVEIRQSGRGYSTIQQGFKKFTDQWWASTQGRNDIRNEAIRSLFLTLANERIESLREKLEDKRPYWQTDEERVGYEYALSEEIKYWESFIKELNEIR